MPVKDYDVVIWLEIHVRIKSKTKMFCNCKNAVELAPEPNLYICPICSWFPGMLPVLNKEVVRLWVIWGMMMGCKVNKNSRFDRKTYFYPDNPTSYQITQMYEPIVWAWSVKVLVNSEEKEFAIHHMHLENDAWKLVHVWWKTLIDLNRAWSPLMEIVTEPVFSTKEEVMEFLKELQKIFRRAWVSDADMEKWQMRCDVNISLKPKWRKEFWTRTETKNINSFSAIWRAIEYETKRQASILDAWWQVNQETRWWDDDAGISRTQRSKEDAMDYRYFPEPDLLPLVLDDSFIEECKKTLPELPHTKRMRYLRDFKLWDDDARILSSDRYLWEYFDEVVVLTNDPKKACSYITSVVLWFMKEQNIDDIRQIKISPKDLSEVINMLNSNELSSTNAKVVLENVFKNWVDPREFAITNNLIQKNDIEALEKIVLEVLKNNPSQVEDYKSWNQKIFGFFVWQCMKLSWWSWNPKIFNELLKKHLI